MKTFTNRDRLKYIAKAFPQFGTSQEDGQELPTENPHGHIINRYITITDDLGIGS